MIGLFLGDTDFSEIVLNKVKRLKKKNFIIDFSRNNKFKKEKNSYRISIGKFGEIIKLIKEKKSKKVLFAGKIANNFSPFLTMRLGASLAIDGAEDVSGFDNIWSGASTFWSPAGFIGGGIEFRWLNRSSVSLHVGYDILKLTEKADNQDDYSGMLIHIAFNRFFKK